MITLKELGAADWRLWRDVRLASLRDAPYAFGSNLADWADAPDHRWRERLERPGWFHVAALQEDRPVGVVSGLPDGDAGVAEMISFWVAPAVRGGGVADDLVGAVERWAVGGGFGILRLAVRPDNARAIAFYRRQGFADTGRPGDQLADGRHELTFEKRLGDSE